MKDIYLLVEAIEYYQNGKWELAVDCYIQFLSDNYQVIVKKLFQ